MRKNIFFFTKGDLYGSGNFNGKMIWSKHRNDAKPLAYTDGQATYIVEKENCNMHWYSLMEDTDKETQMILKIASRIETKILNRATYTKEDEKLITRALAEILIVLKDIIPVE